MGDPDLSTLPQRMRYAADVINEAEQRATREGVIRRANPSAYDLREFADRREAEDRAAADRDAQVEKLAEDLLEQKLSFVSASCRRGLASALIESGWRKADV